MTPLFIGSKLKIERAYKHIADLERLFADVRQRKIHRFSVEKDGNDGSYVVTLQGFKLPSDEIPLFIGDAVHNLRSALDLMACEIVSLAGEVPDKYTMFPIRKDRQELVNTINGGKIKAAPPSIINFIVDTIKPYKGGNDALCSLHDLDIADKHKLLTPVVSVIALLGVSMVDGLGNTFTNMTLTVGEGRKVNMIKGLTDPLKITNYGQPAFGVFFDKGQPFEGNPIIPTLHNLSELVSRVVNTIEEACLATGKY